MFTFVVGKLRYANNSNYKNDTMIRKEVRFFVIIVCGIVVTVLVIREHGI